MADFTSATAIWGAVVATILGMLGLWEFFTRDRIRIDTTYAFHGHEDLDDEIVIANLSNFTVIVSHWKLEWRRRMFGSAKNSIDATPEYYGDLTHFKIDGQSYKTLYFSEQDKIPWGGNVSDGRRFVASQTKCDTGYVRSRHGREIQPPQP